MIQPATPASRFGFLIALCTFAGDQLCKNWLIYGFGMGEREPVAIGPFLTLVMAWNPGISYSLFSAETQNGRLILLAVTLLATLLLAGWLWGAPNRRTALALGLLVGGALGNALDRFAYGKVADFFHIHFGGFSPWGVFNLADVAIVAGVMLLLYVSFFPVRAEMP